MVAVLEKVIELINVSGGGDCALSNYGNMRDVIKPFNYRFKTGVYVYEDECGMGGWALSTLLTGQNRLDYGCILYNNDKVEQIQLKQIGCYVGENIKMKKFFGFADMTVSEQIHFGIHNGLSYSNSISDIKKLFHLSDGRLNRKFKFVGVERWRISMAIGYAMGKSVYCFPWMNSDTVIKLENILADCLFPLINVGAIIFIPTTSYKKISDIIKPYSPIVIGNV